jgi:hypothetical protein
VDHRWQTDAAGRKLFYPAGTDRPGRLVPDEDSEEELRRLLRRGAWRRGRLFFVLNLLVLLVLTLLFSALLGPLGTWAGLVTGLAALGASPLKAVIRAAVDNWHLNQVQQLVASWPEVPPLHSPQEAAALRAGPLWKPILSFLANGLMGLVCLALFAFAQERVLPAASLTGVVYFSGAALISAVRAVLRAFPAR